MPDDATCRICCTLFGFVQFSSGGHALMPINEFGRLHLWRAPSWEEIAAAEAKDPPAPGYGGQGKMESKKP